MRRPLYVAAHVIVLQEDVLVAWCCAGEVHPCRISLCARTHPIVNRSIAVSLVAVFHESRMPSLSLFFTVVLTITAPHETHPWLLMDGTTFVVASRIA